MSSIGKSSEEIRDQEKLLAIIVYGNFRTNGVHFFTKNELSQQLAFMSHKAGVIIKPHIHNEVRRDVFLTQEVLVLKKGKLKVNFYSDKKVYLESRELTAGDVILLIQGGHGFEVIEDVEMFEVKQGPYAGEMDKVRFEPVASSAEYKKAK